MSGVLTSRQIVYLAQVCSGLHILDAELTILRTAFPELSPERMLEWTIGEKTRALLITRANTFGHEIDGQFSCTQCHEQLSVSMNISALLSVAQPKEQRFDLLIEDESIPCRLPTVKHLIHSIKSDDMMEIAKLCVAQSDSAQLDKSILPALIHEFETRDPLIKTSIKSDCLGCQHTDRYQFSIGHYFLQEMMIFSQRITMDVHTLARFYGWSESEILNMSQYRRNTYIEMIG